MTNLFKGWKEVFSFTFVQAVKIKTFKSATITIAILLFLAGILSNVLPVVFSGDSEDESLTFIENVYVKNDTDIAALSFNEFAAFAGENFKDTVFTTTTDDVDSLLKDLEGEESCDVVLQISKADEGYDFQIHIPTISALYTEDCNELLNQSMAYFQSALIASSGISAEALQGASLPINHSSYFDGEEESLGKILFEMIAPMAVSLILYIMILLYGQSIGKSVISEKTSKLMETILTTIRPYALIAGKVLGTFSVAIVQFLIWVGTLIAGFLLGDVLAKAIDKDYSNMILDILNLIKEDSALAFSVPAVILCIVGVVLAFLFYCSLAGAVSSTLTNAENLSQGMSLFQLPVIFGFLISYMLPLYGVSDTIMMACRFIPFTAAFMLPSDILLGNVSLGIGCAALAVMLVFTIAMMMLTAKIYKDKVFYRGNNVIKKGFGKLGLFGR